MLSIKSITSNLEYKFPTEHSNGVKISVKDHPEFKNIESILTEINPQFDTELRLIEFTPQQAQKIQDTILSTYLTEMEPPQQAVRSGPGTAFPFQTIQKFSDAMIDDRSLQVWQSELKLLHISSRGGFLFTNEGN